MFIKSDNEFLEYCGRIYCEADKKVFIYPCSYVKLKFRGKYIKAIVDNNQGYWENYLGCILDGRQSKIKLSDDNYKQELILMENTDSNEHEVMLFKRQDSCHEVGLYGFEVDEDAVLLQLPEKPKGKIEVYGDSVSAGEVSEAFDYMGKPDPNWHMGELSNSYYSYAWLTARKLNAQIHDIAQGGIALLDNTGWFNEPNYIGMESVYDKVRYNPAFGEPVKWDFNNYTPDVVIVAIGQNDSHPDDYMAEDYNCAKAKNWREHYRDFILKLKTIYPEAHIVLCTTILEHHKNWDNAIEEVCREIADEKIHHFLFEKNGSGTPGHIRLQEAEKMSDELAEYIESFGISSLRRGEC